MDKVKNTPQVKAALIMAAKYQKMQEALEYYAGLGGIRAKEALEFDPLSSPSHCAWLNNS